ncbi:MAG: hypothetical protein NXH88_14650 [Hyphomonas sp.]|nr:hypothetical protein [Hyphomonas sp.]
MIKQSYWMAGALIGTVLIAACVEQSSESEFETPVEELMGQGEAMVENLCGECHAIGVDDASAHQAAPPLRDLSKRLALSDLRAPLMEGIVTGHPDMPEWAFEPHHVDALLYYLEQIQSQ